MERRGFLALLTALRLPRVCDKPRALPPASVLSLGVASVTHRRIAAGSISYAQIANGAISSSKIKPGAFFLHSKTFSAKVLKL